MVPHRNHGKDIARLGTIIAAVLLVVAVTLPLWSPLLSPLLPRDVEASIGDSLVEAQPADKFCRGDDGLAALDRVVQRLAKAAGTNGEYRVYVVDAEVFNAFAAPGGRILLFGPIIDSAEDPSEVVGVLAHEMAHVKAGHPSNAVVESLGYGILSLLNPGGDTVGSEAAQALMTNQYSRGDELDADRIGVELLNEAGYDSRGLLTFFDRMKEHGGDIPGVLEFLSTHPSGDHRTEAIADLVQEGNAPLSDDEWAALRAVCETTGKPRATIELR